MQRIRHLVTNLNRIAMIINKFFLFFVLSSSIKSCGCLSKGKAIEDPSIKEFCQTFIKVICTKDTVLFYQHVDKVTLTNSLNSRISEGKRVTENELYFPFFFIYSPIKIKSQDLLLERTKQPFFSNFKMNEIKRVNEFDITFSFEWIQNSLSAESQKILLRIEKKANQWKVIDAEWNLTMGNVSE